MTLETTGQNQPQAQETQEASSNATSNATNVESAENVSSASNSSVGNDQAWKQEIESLRNQVKKATELSEQMNAYLDQPISALINGQGTAKSQVHLPPELAIEAAIQAALARGDNQTAVDLYDQKQQMQVRNDIDRNFMRDSKKYSDLLDENSPTFSKRMLNAAYAAYYTEAEKGEFDKAGEALEEILGGNAVAKAQRDRNVAANKKVADAMGQQPVKDAAAAQAGEAPPGEKKPARNARDLYASLGINYNLAE